MSGVISKRGCGHAAFTLKSLPSRIVRKWLRWLPNNAHEPVVHLSGGRMLTVAERGRDGAFAWGIFEDVASPGRMLETFYVGSWFEHLRQHERVTKADRAIEKKIHALLISATRTTHLLSSQRR
jgi:Transmembrane secretion effector